MIKQKQFAVGAAFLFLAGILPIIIGTSHYLRYLDMYCFQPKAVAESVDWATDSKLRIYHHIMSVNLMNTGAVVCFLSILLSRYKIKSIWVFLLISLVWVAGNDLVAVVTRMKELEELKFPEPIVPIVLGSIGLILTRPLVWATKRNMVI